LKSTFKKFGHILDYNIVVDPIIKESRGFGFVTFESSGGAADAVKELNGTDLQGKDIIVQIAKRSKPRKSTPGKYLGYDRYRGRRSGSRDRDRGRDGGRDRDRDRRRRRSYSYSD